MLSLVLEHIIVPFAVDIVLAAACLCTALANARNDSQMRLPGMSSVASPSPSGEDVAFYEGEGRITMVPTVGWFAAANQLNPRAPEFRPRSVEQTEEEEEEEPEFGPWATEADRDVSSDGMSDDINSYAEVDRSRVEGQRDSATAAAIQNGIQTVLNRRAARGTSGPAPVPPTTSTGRRLPEFKIRGRDLRSLPTHLDPRFRNVKSYSSTWQPRGRAPSDVSPSDFYKPEPEGPIDAWVGDQLHKEPMEFYVDPDCRGSTPGTFADGVMGSCSTTRPSQSVQGDEDEPEEHTASGHLPIPKPDRTNQVGQDPPVPEPVTPAQLTYTEFPHVNEPEQMPVVPVPLGEYIELKEIAEKAKKDAATFEARLEAEFKRLREEMAQSFEGPFSHYGQLSDQEPEQRRRSIQTRTSLPIILSPSLGPQIPCNLLGKSILRRDEKIPTIDTKQPPSELEKKVGLLQRVLEEDAATAGALRDVDIRDLAHGAETGDWSHLSNYQGGALFSTMLQVVANERQDAIELAKKVGRAAVKVVKHDKQPDEKVRAEKELFKSIFDNKFNDFWNEIRPNLSFDKDPLSLSGRRQYPPFYPATGQMPPQPPHNYVKPEFSEIRDELEMILRKMRRFCKQFFSGLGAEELSPEIYDCFLAMCGGSREVLKTLLERKDTKYILVLGFIKRVLFSICLGPGWIWQGYDDNLSGLFSLEHNLFSDEGYKYQRTVALTWRAHRFTQLTYQPWWDHMLDVRVKMVADELYKVLKPMQGEDRSKSGFRQIELFMDLLEIVEIFTKVSAKMYQHEALWSYCFPENGEGFNGANMFSDPQLAADGTPILFCHTPILTYQTPEFGEPYPKSILIVKAECLVTQDLSSPTFRAKLHTNAHEFDIGFRHGRRNATMPNIPYNPRMSTTNDENDAGHSSVNIDPPIIHNRRIFSAEGLFSPEPANPPTLNIRPTRSTPRMSYFGQGNARSNESHNTLQSIPETTVQEPEYHSQYPNVPLGPPQVVPLGPPQVIPLGPPPVIPRSARPPRPPYLPSELPYHAPGLEDTVLMRYAAHRLPGPSGLSDSTRHLQIPNQQPDQSVQRLTQTMRNFQLYDQYEQAARRATAPRNQFGDRITIRHRSAPLLSAAHGALGPDVQRQAMLLRYAIDPNGHLIRTPVKESVGLREADTGFHQTDETEGQQHTSRFGTTQRGASNPNFATFAGRRSNTEMPQRQATHRRDTSDGPQQNVFRRSSPRDDEFPVISFTSTDTNENDENDETLQNPH
ncbi:hypothetical protein TWF569_006152 [Orbilia oligospora]|nr:hypothetical protein TWF569_006152 [Orbilia oligospora]